MSASNLSRSSSDEIFTFKDSFWLLFPVAIALSYWVASYIFQSQDPFYIHVILRNFGDYVFFWLIKALGQINLHPTYVFETPVGSLQPSPMLGIAPYAALYRIFGYWGFVVTDVVVLCANFLALVVLLRLGGARPISALLVAVGSVALMYVVPATHLTPNLPYAFGMRFPRPFVSQLFLIGCFCCLVVQMHVGVKSRRYVKLSAYYAISLALLIQIDTYTSAAAIVAFGLVLVWKNLGRAGHLAQAIRGHIGDRRNNGHSLHTVLRTDTNRRRRDGRAHGSFRAEASACDHRRLCDGQIHDPARRRAGGDFAGCGRAGSACATRGRQPRANSWQGWVSLRSPVHRPFSRPRSSCWRARHWPSSIISR